MSAFAVGDTIKITGVRRHPDADRLLLDNIDVSNASILDVGASMVRLPWNSSSRCRPSPRTSLPTFTCMRP